MVKTEENILKISSGINGYNTFRREDFKKEQLKQLAKWCLEGL